MNNLKILSKLHSIQSRIEKMEKDGKNDFQNYNYLSETQVTVKMKHLLDEYKVMFIYNSQITDLQTWDNSKGVKQFLTAVQVSYEFVDVESGEKISGVAAGQGVDSGDKGIYKAITGAIKYIYMKTFNIPTGDDPEKDNESYFTPTQSVKKPIVDEIPDPTEDWIDNKQDMCPECGKPTKLETTKNGKKMKKCSTNGWDSEKRVATGCKFVEWL